MASSWRSSAGSFGSFCPTDPTGIRRAGSILVARVLRRDYMHAEVVEPCILQTERCESRLLRKRREVVSDITLPAGGGKGVYCNRWAI